MRNSRGSGRRGECCSCVCFRMYAWPLPMGTFGKQIRLMLLLPRCPLKNNTISASSVYPLNSLTYGGLETASGPVLCQPSFVSKSGYLPFSSTGARSLMAPLSLQHGREVSLQMDFLSSKDIYFWEGKVKRGQVGFLP